MEGYLAVGVAHGGLGKVPRFGVVGFELGRLGRWRVEGGGLGDWHPLSAGSVALGCCRIIGVKITGWYRSWADYSGHDTHSDDTHSVIKSSTEQ